MSGKRALNGEILYLIFDAANMHRWNDHLRTVDLTELDKQAHKAAIAWFLGKYEELDGGSKIDWTKIIEHSLFSFIQRSVMTDLKPQVFHRIISEKFEEVNKYVLSCFDANVPRSDPEFRSRLESYLWSEKNSMEDDIIRAAHYLATRWEFKTIYDANRSMYGIENTKKEIDEQIMHHRNLIGVKKQIDDGNTFDFIDLIGQLRFQQRWARTPRIPKTTVLGHSLMVADMIYLGDFDRKADSRQVYNDYYTALFHDLPEVLTKDVISPIKANVDGLAHLLESYEKELVQQKIMPLIPGSWHRELEFMVYEPFTDV
ncbi:MAG: HD domain-containing protein, partial [Candidatus Methanoplasma sp.]|nr:HD domain-containing protein [Candidatus Methanoplasma sp.]